MTIGFAGWMQAAGFIGDGAGQDIDPAFIVTHNGEPVTHNGALVTIGTNIDPAILVTHEGAVVTSGGQIVTHGG